MLTRRIRPIFLIGIFAALTVALAQSNRGRPAMRRHTATTSQPLRLVPATEEPEVDSRHDRRTENGTLVLEANGIPEHKVGQFPNRGNPHTIEEQRYFFKIPADPKVADQVTPLHFSASVQGPPNRPFGVAMNGVLLDPGTAEFWRGDRELDWNYEALGGAVGLGLDENHAHVQPDGSYHYHGLPTLYLKQLGADGTRHSPQIGWAADGFPVYASYGYGDANDPTSPIIELTSSYRLKSGKRPDGDLGPGGNYDGAFVRDYEYVNGLGSLDECNGRYCATPEFPDGTYAYFLTKSWPVVPRYFRGQPVDLRSPGRRPRR
ncbi:MAG: YHYH protein [Planctomycetaceae bacterium]|nr:YHYH protein [Planctomycetaceae bacterium]